MRFLEVLDLRFECTVEGGRRGRGVVCVWGISGLHFVGIILGLDHRHEGLIFDLETLIEYFIKFFL